MSNKSRFLGHGPCDKCGSSDAVGIYEDGPATCFACGAIHKNPLNEDQEDKETPIFKVEKEFVSGPKVSLEEIAEYAERGFKDRQIPKSITSFFGVKAGVNIGGEVSEHYYPYGINQTVGYKVRKLPKEFRMIGKLEGLFGQQLFNGGKRLVITEGELDE